MEQATITSGKYGVAIVNNPFVFTFMGRKSKAKIRQQEILSHFYDVIIEEGFEGASIAKIAKRMDVNPSLLIHYFSTKDAMVLGLIDYIVGTYSLQILPDFSGVADPVERWEDVLDVVSLIQWDRIMNRTVYYSCYALALRNDEIRSRFVELYDILHKQLEVEIDFARKAGVIRDTDTHQTADFILTLVEGTNFMQNVRPGQIDPEAHRAQLKDIIRRYCMP